jgi:hypothetical protein
VARPDKATAVKPQSGDLLVSTLAGTNGSGQNDVSADYYFDGKLALKLRQSVFRMSCTGTFESSASVIRYSHRIEALPSQLTISLKRIMNPVLSKLRRPVYSRFVSSPPLSTQSHRRRIDLLLVTDSNGTRRNQGAPGLWFRERFEGPFFRLFASTSAEQQPCRGTRATTRMRGGVGAHSKCRRLDTTRQRADRTG